jgi:hypothetical protein
MTTTLPSKGDIPADALAFARKAVATGSVTKGDDGFYVDCGGEDHTFRVWRDTNGRVVCNCGDFMERYDEATFRCSHIYAVKVFLEPLVYGVAGDEEPEAADPFDGTDVDASELASLGIYGPVDADAFRQTLLRLAEPPPAEALDTKDGKPYLKGSWGVALLNERVVVWHFRPERIWTERTEVWLFGGRSTTEIICCQGTMTIDGISRGDVGASAVGFIFPPKLKGRASFDECSTDDLKEIAKYVAKVQGQKRKAVLGAVTDAIKRCAHQYGLGLKLYLDAKRPGASRRYDDRSGSDFAPRHSGPAASSDTPGGDQPISAAKKGNILAIAGRYSFDADRVAREAFGRAVDQLTEREAIELIGRLQQMGRNAA